MIFSPKTRIPRIFGCPVCCFGNFQCILLSPPVITLSGGWGGAKVIAIMVAVIGFVNTWILGTKREREGVREGGGGGFSKPLCTLHKQPNLYVEREVGMGKTTF